MRVVMVMFDSLNRRMLPPYGCDWTVAPNFSRLAERSVTFDRSYVCSMPCMPARRDLHTGRPNFLHRSWGPIEPFDHSVPEILKIQGVHTHLASDHQHYWEEGGCNYHTRYSTWQFFRGQEGDPWIGQVADPPNAPRREDVAAPERLDGRNWRQDQINRQHMPTEADQPQTRTFAEGIEYIRRNHEHDDWFLQIETFDPHEPFFTHRDRKDRFAGHYDRYAGRHFDWPVYRTVNETPEEIEHCRYEYASLLNMCDARLGDVLDLFDELNLWDDTMLVVWTDHGFLLGEHDSWAKCWLPFYEEVAHTPFFVWDPRSRRKGERCDALVQPSIDLGPTLLEAFGQPVPDEMLGKPLGETLASGAPVREAGVFGMFGMAVNLVEGPHVYMRGPVTADNTPLNDYTLMPTNMHHTFSPDLMRSGRISLAEPFSFTQGCATMRIPNQGYNWDDTRPAPQRIPTLLFDVEQDPLQRAPIDDPAVEQRLAGRIVELMKQCDAPPEQYERLGLAEPARG